MSGESLTAAIAILKRDVRIYLTYRLRFVGQVLGALFSLTLFYYLSRLVRVEAFASADDYYAFVVVGLVILQVLNSTLAVPGQVRGELLAGTFERLVVSPAGPVVSVLAMTVFPLALSMVLAVVMLTLAGVVFGLPVAWSTAAFAIPVALLGALAFAPVGVLVGALVLVVKQAGAAATWITALISIVAGLYFPVALLPDWIEWTSEVQPFTPAVDVLRHLLVGTPLRGDLAIELLKLAGFAVTLLPLAVWALVAAVRIGRRRGTIIEY